MRNHIHQVMHEQIINEARITMTKVTTDQNTDHTIHNTNHPENRNFVLDLDHLTDAYHRKEAVETLDKYHLVHRTVIDVTIILAHRGHIRNRRLLIIHHKDTNHQMKVR